MTLSVADWSRSRHGVKAPGECPACPPVCPPVCPPACQSSGGRPGGWPRRSGQPARHAVGSRFTPALRSHDVHVHFDPPSPSPSTAPCASGADAPDAPVSNRRPPDVPHLIQNVSRPIRNPGFVDGAVIVARGAAIVSVIVDGADKSVCPHVYPVCPRLSACLSVSVRVCPVRPRWHPPDGPLTVPRAHLATADIPVNLFAYCRPANA